MALCGSGAMLLYYDIAPGAVADHDDWHTREHVAERLSIPGFLRGSRWVATAGSPRYLVMYEVADVPVLSGAPYLERLDNPTPWTARMMVNFRGMARGFCRVVSSSGLGLGHALLSIRYAPVAGRENELREWLMGAVLPALAMQPGAAGAYLLEPAATPPMSREQGIRGKDAAIPWVLLVTGYNAETLGRFADDELCAERFAEHGGSSQSARGRYGLDFSLTDRELVAHS